MTAKYDFWGSKEQEVTANLMKRRVCPTCGSENLNKYYSAEPNSEGVFIKNLKFVYVCEECRDGLAVGLPFTKVEEMDEFVSFCKRVKEGIEEPAL